MADRVALSFMSFSSLARSGHGQSNRLAAGIVLFEEKAKQKILGGQHPVVDRGAPIAERREILRQERCGSGEGPFTPGLADQRLFCRQGRFGVPAMPPKAMQQAEMTPFATVPLIPAGRDEISSSRRLEIL